MEISEFRKKPSDDYDLDDNGSKMGKTHGSNIDNLGGNNNNENEDMS